MAVWDSIVNQQTLLAPAKPGGWLTFPQRKPGDIGEILLHRPGEIMRDVPVELTPMVTPEYWATLLAIITILSGCGLIAVVACSLEAWLTIGLVKTANSNSGAGAVILTLLALPCGCAWFWWALQMRNPGVSVRLKPGPIMLGRPITMEWEIEAGKLPLSRLGFYLEGREEEIIQGGESSSVRKSVFCRKTLLEIAEGEKLRGGNVVLEPLSAVMHSLNMGIRKIVWELRVSGEVSKWVSFENKFTVAVLPADWKEEMQG